MLRRLLFAAVHLPNYWGFALEYVTNGKTVDLTSEQVKMLVENLDAEAFATDRKGLLEFSSFIIKALWCDTIITRLKSCVVCGSSLKLRKDRPASK